MFRKKAGEGKKKRSWECADEEEDGPSESFLQLQRELEEKAKLAAENEDLIRAKLEAAANDEQGAYGDGSASSMSNRSFNQDHAANDESRTTVLVKGFNPKTRVHEVELQPRASLIRPAPRGVPPPHELPAAPLCRSSNTSISSASSWRSQ